MLIVTTLFSYHDFNTIQQYMVRVFNVPLNTMVFFTFFTNLYLYCIYNFDKALLVTFQDFG